MVYQKRVKAAIEEDSPAIQGRKELYQDTLKLIDGLLEVDVVFPETVLQNAELVAATMDDLLVDHLIYQGI